MIELKVITNIKRKDLKDSLNDNKRIERYFKESE